MSLDDLRAQAEAEESEEIEQPEIEEPEELEEEPEGDTEETEDPGAEETEESEEYELELDGEPEPDQQKPSPQEAILHKLTKQRKKRQEAESENEQLKQRLAELEAKLNGSYAQLPQQPRQPEVQLPPFPDLYDEGIDGDRKKYDQAIKIWWVESRKAEQAVSQQSEQENYQRKLIEDKARVLAERVGKFATEHKMNSDYVANAVERARQEVDDASGIDGSLAYLLDAVGEGSEKAAIWIGTDKGAKDLQKIKELLALDNSGLKAIAHLTRIAARKPAQRKTSKAPEPDRPLHGDGSSKSARKLQEKYDAASTKMDMKAMREIKSQADKLGVRLN